MMIGTRLFTRAAFRPASALNIPHNSSVCRSVFQLAVDHAIEAAMQPCLAAYGVMFTIDRLVEDVGGTRVAVGVRDGQSYSIHGGPSPISIVLCIEALLHCFGFAHSSLPIPKQCARIIAASVRVDGVMEAQSDIDVMSLLCKMKSVPKLLYRNHRRILDTVRASAEPRSCFVIEVI